MITRNQTKILTICALIALSVISYFFITSRILFINLDEMVVATQSGIAPWPENYKDNYFNQTYPSSSDVSTFLSDFTFTRSHNWGPLKNGDPNYENSVYYFSPNNKITFWHNSGRIVGPLDISKGHWWTENIFIIIKYGNKRRYAIATRYCDWFSNYAEQREIENCFIVHSQITTPPEQKLTHSIIAHDWPSDTVDRRAGDVLKINDTTIAPFALPFDRSINIDQLLK